MATLIFEDRGYTVVTSASTAASNSPGRTAISYGWGASPGWSPNATGASRIELQVDIETFLRRLYAGGGVLDLRAEA